MDSSLVSAAVVVIVLFVAFRMLPRLVAGVPFVSPDAVHVRLQDNPDAVLIDVRTPEEYANEHVPGSVNVQPHTFADDLEQKKAFLDTKVYVMCLSSQRSAMAAKNLKNLGFSNVSVVKGGLTLWKKQGLPTTKS